MDHPHIAVSNVIGRYPGQLSLETDQVVTVLDSYRDDWWLVRTVDSVKSEGWVPRDMLQPSADGECMCMCVNTHWSLSSLPSHHLLLIDPSHR